MRIDGPGGDIAGAAPDGFLKVASRKQAPDIAEKCDRKLEFLRRELDRASILADLSALDVMDRAGSSARNPEFQSLRGAVLQRMSRHAEAVDAFYNSVRTSAQPGTTWIGLGISLEALGRRPEAVVAYRRALGAGPLTQELRDYAESRAKALE